MHIKESNYQKRTGTRASAIGVGSGGPQHAELRALGISDSALRLLDELIAEGCPPDSALSRAIMATDLPLYQAIDRVEGANPRLGFYGRIRQYLRIQRRNQKQQ